MTTLQLVLAAAPDDEDVVAGWGAFGLFGLGILAVVLLGFSLVKRLKNVEKAAASGLYDPSDPPRRQRPPRGLAAVRQQREQGESDAAPSDERDA
ncbi:hypothetical protein ABFT23_19390 [Nocardioides sp. C4-1]|uniref:hypothetical protein n=1 Tax=Nocardioides sp. C4-1 TaxID=3151851 RepID=UPI00326416ED